MSDLPRRGAVLGSPISHSLSPALHQAAYVALGLDWRYDAIEVTEPELPGFIANLDRSWVGLSLTMPLKEAVIDLLDEVDATARAIRAVNTVLPSDRGWQGTNTDVSGIVTALREAGAPDRLASATVLGAGATARSAVAALAMLGVGHVTICARRRAAAEDVAGLAARLGLAAEASDAAPRPDLLAADVVVCTLPDVGGEPWAAVADSAQGVLLDAAYDPWPTPLAAAWPVETIASGRDLLLWQAVEQVRLMTGQQAPLDAMRRALSSPPLSDQVD